MSYNRLRHSLPPFILFITWVPSGNYDFPVLLFNAAAMLFLNINTKYLSEGKLQPKLTILFVEEYKAPSYLSFKSWVHWNSKKEESCQRGFCLT